MRTSRLTAALGLLAVLAASAAGAVRTADVAAAGSPAWTRVPGALPPGFVYRYDSPTYYGWPVAPVHREHPIRGSFLDARGGGYHFGVDIAVDDGEHGAGAPKGLSHPVYAVDGGLADLRPGDRRVGCVNRRLDVGRFAFWHVSPIVTQHQRIRPGQQIGWTCEGLWHVHLSEWQVLAGARVWVNPLHEGGKLTPYRNAEFPVIEQVRFFGPPRSPWRSWTQPDPADPLRPRALHGSVDIRAKVEDRQTFAGFLGKDPRLPAPDAPYKLGIEILDARDKAVLRDTAFQADLLPAGSPWYVHFAPGTLPDLSIEACLKVKAGVPCVPSHWYRPLSRYALRLWDTRRVPNGGYTVVISSSDSQGNLAVARVPVTVAN